VVIVDQREIKNTRYEDVIGLIESNKAKSPQIKEGVMRSSNSGSFQYHQQ